MRFTKLAMLTLLSTSAVAFEWDFSNLTEKNDPQADASDWAALFAAADEYVAKSGADVEKFEKRWKIKIDTRADDQRMSQDDAYMSLLFDWAADNQKALERMDKDAILEICLHLKRVNRLKLDLPWQFKEYTTRPLINKFIAVLKGK
jgi:hypothetical protein